MGFNFQHNSNLFKFMNFLHICIVLNKICQVSYHALYSPCMLYRDIACRKFGNFLAKWGKADKY